MLWRSLFRGAAALTRKEDGGAARRAQAAKKMADGNFKDAYGLFSVLVLDAKDDAKLAGGDLHNAIQCLQNLNREDEVDDLREKAIAVQSGNWRFLGAAAESFTIGNHVGYVVGGKFSRGHRRGQGKYVSALARDRVRALQLFRQALPATANGRITRRSRSFIRERPRTRSCSTVTPKHGVCRI